MKRDETVRRSQVLDELDIRVLPDGRKRVFSIKFVTKEGKLYYFPRAFSCGAGRMNQREYRMVGIRPCDCQGNPEGHVTPVVIDNILQFDGRRVVFGNEQL